ncbi:copper chaperone [Alicyclobacillaceae bacterium I2511]|nr:copper chaperone [Alicyclobacillaceae bacterium I2511]
METQVLKVKGMTCQHCKRAVEGALQDLPGVAKAVVDLEKGEVSVNFSQPVAQNVLAAAIDEAGYELVS